MKATQLTENLNRFSPVSRYGSNVDVAICNDQQKNLNGCGTVHHIAFSKIECECYDMVEQKILSIGETVISRQLPNKFSSLYFRLAEGILFELLHESSSSSEELKNQFLLQYTELKKSLQQNAKNNVLFISKPVANLFNPHIHTENLKMTTQEVF